jgi:hypothetical protein
LQKIGSNKCKLDSIKITNSQNITLTNHALQRAVERGITREAIFEAIESPLKVGPIRVDSIGRPSQRFIGKKAEVAINPETRKVVSVNKTKTKKAEKLITELSNAH